MLASPNKSAIDRADRHLIPFSRLAWMFIAQGDDLDWRAMSYRPRFICEAGDGMPARGSVMPSKPPLGLWPSRPARLLVLPGARWARPRNGGSIKICRSSSVRVRRMMAVDAKRFLTIRQRDGANGGWSVGKSEELRSMGLKRAVDFFLALIAAAILLVPILVVALCVRLTSPGPILYWSKRVGRFNQIFLMPKFRSMRVDTPTVATHLLEDPDRFLTPIGSFLRKSSLDELPQLWCILEGKMSFVGPRPALYNQYDLIELRTTHGVDKLLPGLTGWAQINGRDELPIPEKVKFDVEYLERRSFGFDISILFMTAEKVIRRKGIRH
ncbi:putative galactosyltransferase protein (plasmid) [Rhizobium johnstonii 3841]|uniref:Galactosyltransferase protein n=3 Tax=Rhizobium TaxID=379 RepID=Q1M8M2_RHIJ3|nr:putative galactosyltransferase protein [Rhizobium johnstonii 3841]